jgi:hypothetical protein
MTSSRTLLSGASSALLALLFMACSGDPGASIPAPAAAEPAPGASDPAASSGGTDPSSSGAPGTAVLTVTVEGTGRVVSQPAGIDCPGQCSATFAAGTHVTLASTPAEGWRFDAWRGACSGAGACTVVATADSSVTSSLALVDARWNPAVGAADCMSAWGANGEKLSPCDTLKDDYVVVHKSARNVALCKSGKLVKNFRSGLGSKPSGDKVKDGDGRTPEGVFYVPRLVPNSTYYKAFLLSYPSLDDAARGVTSGLITPAQRSQIESAHAACVEPPQTTALGGDLELHGNGSSADWTAGCVALDDSSIDLLWSSIGAGDTIVVVP